MTWVPDDQRPTAWFLFDQSQTYAIHIAQMDVYSIDELRERGIPSTGDSDFDADIARATVRCHWTIAHMAERHNDGTSFSVVNDKDLVTIYQKIQNHLLFWRQQIDTSFHQINPELIDDLKLLEKFAVVVYNKAAWHFKDNNGPDHVSNILHSLIGMKPVENRDRINGYVRLLEDGTPEIAPRKSIIELAPSMPTEGWR
jgi:hypothetical protein